MAPSSQISLRCATAGAVRVSGASARVSASMMSPTDSAVQRDVKKHACGCSARAVVYTHRPAFTTACTRGRSDGWVCKALNRWSVGVLAVTWSLVALPEAGPSRQYTAHRTR